MTPMGCDAAMFESNLQKDQDRTQEESGKNPEPQSASLLAGAAQLAVDAAQGLRDGGRTGDWVTLLHALAELTTQEGNAGNPSPRLTAERLRREAGRLAGKGGAYWTSDEETGRKKFSNAWKALLDAVPRLEGNLVGRARKKGIPGRVMPVEEAEGRSKLYGLRVETVDLTVSGSPSGGLLPMIGATRPAATIEYGEELEIYPIPGIKRPLRWLLTGWKRAILIFVILATMALLLGATIVSMIIWLADSSLARKAQDTVSLVLASGALVFLFWPLYRLLEDGIVMAPAILELAIPEGNVLVLRPNPDGTAKEIHMVRFTGTCTICGGTVTIARGRRRFRGRLVGRCIRNPLEHIFSFDHVMLVGCHLYG